MNERNGRIVAEFGELFRDGLRQEVIFDRLADKHVLAPNTVAKIVYRTSVKNFKE